MGLVLHGDAAFAGQGVVAETLQLANLPGTFSVGVHRRDLLTKLDCSCRMIEAVVANLLNVLQWPDPF